MRAKVCLLALALLAAGCEVQDENPNWAPRQDYPSWTYDAPYYYQPSDDLPVAEVVGSGIPAYYTDNNFFFVKHSTGYQVPNVPRQAVWYSTDAGQQWRRAGYFGVEQTHFLFRAKADGPHWIRFVGTGQGVAAATPGTPHRIYIVDTTGPMIELSVYPPPIEKDEEGNEVPHIYKVGDKIHVRWNVRDDNLIPNSIRMATTFGSFPENTVWSGFPVSLASSGLEEVPIPPEAAGRRGRCGGRMQFRIEAVDKAGNINFAFSKKLHVDGPPLPPGRPIARPVGPWEMIAQTEGKPGPKPGWPQPGTLIRGGTSQILQWLPTGTDKYKNVVLQFSANNGRSWRTVAENIQAGKPVKWTVPQVNSKLCRIRILAIIKAEKDQKEHLLMLAMTQRFTVHTAPPDTILGPKEVPKEPREEPPEPREQ